MIKVVLLSILAVQCVLGYSQITFGRVDSVIYERPSHKKLWSASTKGCIRWREKTADSIMKYQSLLLNQPQTEVEKLLGVPDSIISNKTKYAWGYITEFGNQCNPYNKNPIDVEIIWIDFNTSLKVSNISSNLGFSRKYKHIFNSLKFKFDWKGCFGYRETVFGNILQSYNSFTGLTPGEIREIFGNPDMENNIGYYYYCKYHEDSFPKNQYNTSKYFNCDYWYLIVEFENNIVKDITCGADCE